MATSAVGWSLCDEVDKTRVSNFGKIRAHEHPNTHPHDLQHTICPSAIRRISVECDADAIASSEILRTTNGAATAPNINSEPRGAACVGGAKLTHKRNTRIIKEN